MTLCKRHTRYQYTRSNPISLSPSLVWAIATHLLNIRTIHPRAKYGTIYHNPNPKWSWTCSPNPRTGRRFVRTNHILPMPLRLWKRSVWLKKYTLAAWAWYIIYIHCPNVPGERPTINRKLWKRVMPPQPSYYCPKDTPKRTPSTSDYKYVEWGSKVTSSRLRGTSFSSGNLAIWSSVK